MLAISQAFFTSSDCNWGKIIVSILKINKLLPIKNKYINSVTCPKSYNSYGAESRFKPKPSKLVLFPLTTQSQKAPVKPVCGQSGEYCTGHVLDFHLTNLPWQIEERFHRLELEVSSSQPSTLNASSENITVTWNIFYMDLKTFSEVESPVFMVASPVVLFNNKKCDYRMKILQGKITCYNINS